MTLNEVMKETADAIREKKGASEISSKTFNDILAEVRIQLPEVADVWDATLKITEEEFYSLD